MKAFENKIVVLTGASSGIGYSLLNYFVKEGARVYGSSRNERELTTESKQECNFELLDLADELNVEKYVKTILQKENRIDILINNAGVAHNLALVEEIDSEMLNSVVRDNLLPTFNMMKYIIPIMKKNRNGRIINITTIHGKQPSKSSVPTSITRAAGIAFTKALSNDYAQYNILVNTVCLGFVKSNQWVTSKKLDFPDLTQKQYYDNIGKGTPLGRIGETEEAADLITYLASERSSYITGTAINLDGGLSAVI